MSSEEPVWWLVLVEHDDDMKIEWVMEFNAESAVEMVESRYPDRVIGYYDEDDNYIRTRIIND